MIAKYKALLRNRFARRLAVLSGGFVAGQGIVLLVSPILTRLYTPAEFGLYAVFTAFVTIALNLVSLRYELAVPVARTARDAAALTALAAWTAVAVCLAGLPLVWLGGPALAAATGMPQLAPALWLLPPVAALYSILETLSHWSIYRGTFRLNASARVWQSVAQSVLQVGLGVLGQHAWGLLVGYVAGCVGRLGYLWAGLAPADRMRLLRARPARMLRLARRHWQYPAYTTPASALESGTQLLPLVFLAVLYGPALAGLFGLGQRLMGLPVRLFAQAAKQVFLGEAAHREPQALYRLFKRSSLLFLGVGILGLAPLAVAGPALFAVLFGEAWRTSGEIVQLLVPLYLARFVVTPVSQTLNILGRQNLHLVSSTLDAGLMLAVVAAAWWLSLPPLRTVLLLSLGSTLAYGLYFALSWRAARRHAHAPEAPAARPRPVSSVAD